MRLEIVDAALAEAQATKVYYAAVRTELGDAFVAELDATIARVMARPLAWPSRDGNTRRSLLNRFPYTVVFRVEDELIRVIAVMHQRQRPGYWQGR